MPTFIRKQNRLKEYDYSADGEYFVTVCTADKACILGRITPGSGETLLSEIGKIAASSLERLPEVFHGVSIPAYVIMPNHLHMIVRLSDSSRTLSQILNSFKGAVSKQARMSVWQKSFYDHIIRDDDDYNRIREYIANNPAVWAGDESS